MSYGFPRRRFFTNLTLALLPTLVTLGIYLVTGPVCLGQAITFDLGDLVIFFGSSSWLDGQGVLYRDILSEYPLLANLIFGAVRVVSFGLLPLFNAFTAYCAVWFLASATVYAFILRQMQGRRFPAEAYWAILGPAAIHFTFLRYDIYPALFSFLALTALKDGKLDRGSLWLGLCIAVKGYALFLLPAFAVYVWRNHSLRQAARQLAIAVAPFLFSQLAIYAWAGREGVLGPFLFHLGRDFNGESIYDSIALVMETVGVSSAPFRAFVLASPLPKLIAGGTALAAAALRPKSFDNLVDSWLFAVSGFILSSVFISPQWLLWILPIACFSEHYRVHRIMAGLSYATFLYYPILAGLAAVTGPFVHSASMALVNVFRVALMVDIGRRSFATGGVPLKAALVGLALLLPSVGLAAAGTISDAKEEERNSYYLLPFAAYTPETRLVLGGSALALLRNIRASKEVPISTISLSLTGTQNRQYVVGLSPDIFTPDGEWEFRPFVGGQLYPSSFIGIGSHLTTAGRENYTARGFNSNFYVQKRIGGAWRLGPFLEFQSYTNEGLAPGGQLARGVVAGAAGTRFFGVGVNLEWDDLDNRQFPGSGSHVGLSAIHFDRHLGTTDPYQRVVMDFKYFYSLAAGHVLAGQFFSRTVFGSPPFQALSSPGGGLLRGIDGGRALDRSVVSAQIEYRFPLLYRLRGDVFAGVAEVGSSFRAIPWGNPIPAAGAGLRWTLDRESKINVRFDLARSALGDGFYAAIGEGF